MPLLTRLSLTGEVTQLLLRPSRASGFEKARTGRLALTLDGPVGDCHTGATRKSDSRTLPLYKRNIDIRNVRQITILSEEELAAIAQALSIPEVKAEWLGANMVLRGIPDVTLLPPSTRLQFPSGATLVVDMENLPCRQIADQVAEHHPAVQFTLVKAAMHKRGVTCWVEREGEIVTGDAVGVFIPPQRIYAHGT
jgi:MOSC domain